MTDAEKEKATQLPSGFDPRHRVNRIAYSHLNALGWTGFSLVVEEGSQYRNSFWASWGVTDGYERMI